MSWEKLDLHIENLIPGTVLLAIVIIGWAIPLKTLTVNDVILGIAFVGTAYMIGAVGNVLARFLLDFVCRKTIRATFMRFFVGERLEVAKATPAAINKRFSEVITAGLSCGNSRVEAEVEKRRQTGRILRSTLVPAILAVIALGENLNWDILKTLFVGLGIYGVLLVLYAYSEVIIFQEGYRGGRLSKSKKSHLVLLCHLVGQLSKEPANTACTRRVGLCAFFGSFLGSSLVPAKWCSLVPPTRG